MRPHVSSRCRARKSRRRISRYDARQTPGPFYPFPGILIPGCLLYARRVASRARHSRRCADDLGKSARYLGAFRRRTTDNPQRRASSVWTAWNAKPIAPRQVAETDPFRPESKLRPFNMGLTAAGRGANPALRMTMPMTPRTTKGSRVGR